MEAESRIVQLPWGRALAYFRERKGLSQEQVADWVGTTQSSVARWEQRSKPLPDRPVLARLAALFGIAVDDMEGGVVRTADPLAALSLAEEQMVTLSAIRAVLPEDAEGLNVVRSLLEVLADMRIEDRYVVLDMAQNLWERRKGRIQGIRVLGDMAQGSYSRETRVSTELDTDILEPPDG